MAHLPPHWKQHLLGAIGGTPTREVLRFLDGWACAEGAGGENNPLNTTFALPGSTIVGGTPGVRNYQRPLWGVAATVLTLTEPSQGTLTFPKVLGHLQGTALTAEEIVTDCRSELHTWGTNPDVILGCLQTIGEKET